MTFDPKQLLKPGSSRHVYDLDSKVLFGKHAGKTLGQIIAKDPSWVEWARDNIPSFHLQLNAGRVLALALSQQRDQRTDRYRSIDDRTAFRPSGLDEEEED